MEVPGHRIPDKRDATVVAQPVTSANTLKII
jgi:hypothetical protein